MECLDKLNSGVREQTMGVDIDCPPIASPATDHQLAIFSDALQASFNVLWEALVYLGPAVRW